MSIFSVGIQHLDKEFGYVEALWNRDEIFYSEKTV